MGKIKKKKLFIALGIVAAVIVAIMIASMLIFRQNKFIYHGWINCQPMLTEEEAELCERAEEAGYPYIAY